MRKGFSGQGMSESTLKKDKPVVQSSEGHKGQEGGKFTGPRVEENFSEQDEDVFWTKGLLDKGPAGCVRGMGRGGRSRHQ